jgi:hypothetical protein
METSTPSYPDSTSSIKEPGDSSSTSVKCRRCEEELAKEKGATIVFKKRTFRFCDTCFKSVFKYDENMRTVTQLWEENGKSFPFIVRSSNWHKSSYMKIKNIHNSGEGNGKQKSSFIGDMYLRGELKEQDRNVGKANHYIWYKWSEELAQKYKESPGAEMENQGSLEMGQRPTPAS